MFCLIVAAPFSIVILDYSGFTVRNVCKGVGGFQCAIAPFRSRGVGFRERLTVTYSHRSISFHIIEAPEFRKWT